MNKYIDVRINEERFCTEGVAEFSILDMDALSEDGYVVKQNGVREIGYFFEENIFSPKDCETALGEREPNLQEAKRLRKIVEDAFEKYNQTHENSADQEVARYCQKIEPKELAWWEESWQVVAEFTPLCCRRRRKRRRNDFSERGNRESCQLVGGEDTRRSAAQQWR